MILASCPKFYLYKYESVCEQGQLQYQSAQSNILLAPLDQIKIVAMEVLKWTWDTSVATNMVILTVKNKSSTPLALSNHKTVIWML